MRMTKKEEAHSRLRQCQVFGLSEDFISYMNWRDGVPTNFKPTLWDKVRWVLGFVN